MSRTVSELWDRLRTSPIGYRLAHGSLWALVGSVGNRGFALVASIFVARTLGKVGFGEFGIIQSTIEMVVVFAGFSMGVTATKHVAEFRATDPIRAGRVHGLTTAVSGLSGTVMALALFFGAPWLADHTLAAPHLTPFIRISALVLFLAALGGAQSGTLSGLEAFKRLAQINFWSGFVRLPVLVVGVWKWGLLGAIWALVIDQVVLLGLCYWGVRKEAARSGLLLTIRNLWSEAGLIWRFSVPALLTGILYGPTHWVCNALLVNHRDGYAQMGQFNAANQWFWALLFLPSVLGQVTLPVLCERVGQNNRSDTRRVMMMSVKINAIVTTPLVICGSLVSPFIMGLYGMGFRDGWPTMVAVLLTGSIMAIQMPFAQTISAVGKMWVLSLMNLAWATCFLGLTWLLVGWGWGALGLAVARFGSHLVHTGWLFAYARKLLNDTGNDKNWMQPDFRPQ